MLQEAPQFLIALEQSGLGAAIRQSVWLYPAANVGHILALTLFAGGVVAMDLRLIGAFAAAPPAAIVRPARALAVAGEVRGVALAMDAKNEHAARWYERFGAQPLLDDPLKLILPLGVIADAIMWAGRRQSEQKNPLELTKARREAQALREYRMSGLARARAARRPF